MTHWVPLVLFVTLGIDAAAPPSTRKEPVTDVLHGVPVTEDYRWLEDASRKDVQDWSTAQNAHARGILDKLPGVDRIRARVRQILTAETVSHSRITACGAQFLAMKSQPPKNQPFLVLLAALDRPDSARVLVDPNALDAGGTTAIDWYVPSPDGKLVAVSLSKGGSESGDVHVYETATGKQVHEVVPRVNGGTAGGDLAWDAAGKGFYCTRYPRGDERPPEDRAFYQQLWYHELGTPAEKDRYELGKDLPRVAEIIVEVDASSGRVLASVQDGDSGRFAHFVRSPDGTWRQFSRFGDGIVQAAFGPGESIYVVSRRNAPRGKVLRLSAAEPDVDRARVVVPEGPDAIITDHYRVLSRQTVVLTATRLWVMYQRGGPSELRAFDLDGKLLPSPQQLPVGTVRWVTRLCGDDVLFANSSYVEPLAQYVYRAASGRTVKLPLTTPGPVDFRDIRVVRETARSQDGTPVPVNILLPAGAKRDGTAPCLVTGYGGFGLSREPSFRAVQRVLFDHGFIWAEANLRGGGEFGDEWHRAGMLTRKQNVFDDFAAVLRQLVEQKYTAPARLAIQGGSNGGLLMGATLTQRPELMRAVVAHVGIYDMLRVERSSNGAFNIPEFGTVKDAEQFRALRAYSPYHNVKDGVNYPAVLFLTGLNDPRVDPMQSRKMTARLQAATASGHPVLLRTSASSGHGLDTSLAERIEEYVDVYAFLFAQLGVPVR